MPSKRVGAFAQGPAHWNPLEKMQSETISKCSGGTTGPLTAVMAGSFASGTTTAAVFGHAERFWQAPPMYLDDFKVFTMAVGALGT